MEQEYDENQKIKIAGIIEESIVDGPGMRFVLFVQGCNHKCEGCHNSHTQDFNGGEYMTIGEILEKIRENPLLDGVTFSGGEPFEQADVLSKLAKQLRQLNYHVITYSGYTYEAIEKRALEDLGWSELIENSDVLIDGRFENEKRNLKLRFRGSENQRVIDIKKTKSTGVITLIDL